MNLAAQSVRLLPDRITNCTLVLTFAILWSIAAVKLVRGDDFSSDTRFFKQLTAPMTSVLDGKPFRGALESVAAQPGLNLWLDRHVDPSVLIEVGPVGPTVIAAIEQLANSQGCTVMPIANVVLVGRERWVQHTAGTILSIPAAKRGGAINVSWNDLTTPEEALRQLVGDAAKVVEKLPHDLWPAVHWQGIERQVAISLIQAQFDSAADERASTNERPPTFTRRYSGGAAALSMMRKAMLASDPSSQLRVSGTWIVAKGNLQAHQAATNAMLHEAGDAAGPDPDADTFTLKKMTTSAENALQQLAQTARRTCIIKPEAVAACKTVISIEGSDITLRQLIDMIANQAGVQASWQDNTIVISLAP